MSNKAETSQGSPKILVLYKTKYGSTKQYADWIGEALNADVMSIEEVFPETLQRYATVVIGGSVRIGTITCANFLKNHWSTLKDKRVVLFSVSATKPDDPEVQEYYEKSIPSDIRAAIHYVPLWGRFDALDWKDRFLMIFPRQQLRSQLRKDPTNEELRKKYEGMMKPFDHVERSTINPIIQYCNSL